MGVAHPSDRRARASCSGRWPAYETRLLGRLTSNTDPLGRLNDRELVSLRRLLGTALRRPAAP